MIGDAAGLSVEDGPFLANSRIPPDHQPIGNLASLAFACPVESGRVGAFPTGSVARSRRTFGTDMTDQPHASPDAPSSPRPSAGRSRKSRACWRRRLFVTAAALALTAATGTVLVSLVASPSLLAGIAAVAGGGALFEVGRRSARRDIGRLYDAAVGSAEEGDGFGDLVIRCDTAGRITSTSPATTARLGQPPGAFVGLDYSTFAADLAAG